MAAPPDDLAIAQLDEAALAELEWTHDGVDLDRFEVLSKGPDDDVWTSEILAPAGDFGAGPYTAEVPTGEDFDWVVRALEADGTVSLVNPKVRFQHTPDGVWLLPIKKNGRVDRDRRAWVGTVWPDVDRPLPEDIFDIRTRADEPGHAGKLKLRRGTIEGTLLQRHGKTATEWRNRLVWLVRHQDHYRRVVLAGSRGHFRVKLGSILRESATRVGGKRAWEIRVAFRETNR